MLCNNKEIKLYGESVEKHERIETRLDGEEHRQDPTCGEDGWVYVALKCTCGFWDTNSIKKTVIPATDNHVFGGIKDNPAYVLWSNAKVQVGGRPGIGPISEIPTAYEVLS